MSVLFSKLCRPLTCTQVTKLCAAPRINVLTLFNGRRHASSTQSKSLITWRSFTITAICGGIFVYWIKDMMKEKEKRDILERKRQLGKAAIGGRIELIDQDGKLRTSDEFKGQWLLIYFGFTHCPDICPDELEKMVKTTEIINKNKFVQSILPVFITVDPERDSPAIVGKYIREFSPNFIGLTGTREQVDKVCKAFRVYHSAGPKDEEADYIVDHTIIIYLINPDGDFVDYYGQTKNAEDVANGIELQMLKYKKMLDYDKPSKISSIFKSNPDVQS